MSDLYCLNPECRLYNETGRDNIVKFGVYRSKQGGRARYLCKSCGRTFSERANSKLYGLHANEDTVNKFLAEYRSGKPLNRISREMRVKADTLRAWRKRFMETDDGLSAVATLAAAPVASDELKIGLSPNLIPADQLTSSPHSLSFSVNWASLCFLMWMLNVNHLLEERAGDA
ncbi:MAG TPA: hypothetical protein VMD02_01405 [Candidatus Omnitrophota bacterium]|nr:hypothetical protein [Candidatus Omnitrophota bacterium]